jgi:hypothetical protein
MWCASTNAACLGQSRKPLDAAIGRLLSPYCPGSRWGNSKQNNNKKCTNFAGHFDGHGGASVGYRTHPLVEEVQGFTRNHWTPPLGKYYVK